MIRATVITGLRAGRSVAEIVKFNNLKRSTVRDVKQRYAAHIAAGGRPEDFSSKRKEHRKRSDCLDGRIVAALQDLADRDPGRSMRSMARELGISEATVRNKMKEDTRFKSFSLRRNQMTEKATKEKRSEKTKPKNQAANGQQPSSDENKTFHRTRKRTEKTTSG